MARLTPLLEELRRVGPPPVTRWAAVRAGGTLLVALLVLHAADAMELGAAATFGAFAAIYGGAVPYRRRWRQQVALAVVLTGAVATGSLAATSEHRAWWAVLVAALWSGIGAAGSDRWRWRPPGPVFLVFAAATCASVPTELGRVPVAIGVCAATAAFAVTLAVVETAIEVRRGDVPEHPPPLPPLPPGRQRLHAVRCVVVVLVAGGLMTSTGLAHPYWAMVAAVVPLAATTLRQQVARGVHRVIGTLLGLVLAGLLLVLPLPALATIVVVALLQAGTELVVTRHYGLALVLITPLALLVTDLAHPEPLGELLGSRFVETAVGAAIGLGAAVLTRRRRTTSPAAR
ncbi:FUSC family protein [Nocardioides nitrophenolicus]|uniref:FUSC family protein n=1 Tax=Nocardioides nitrophenolicus TaxID=60489 RepID=UPI001958D8B1|nr:FUSC family protein [Nocardioides nitrophenolicus]MBM7516730.1 hypothetical protein [Nocardioides nitrophenolicus]